MTTAATSLLGLALPVTGELQGTWGDTVNNSITSLLDTAIAGTTTLSTDGDVTLSTTTLAANQARQAILLCSGARTAIRTITAPAQSKIYTIINATTGGYAVKLVGVGPTTGLTIPNGASAVVAWNGSDFIEIGSSTVGNLTVNGNLTVTGTTTLSAGTANGVAYLNGSKVLTTGNALVFDGTNLTTTNVKASGLVYAGVSASSGGQFRVFNASNDKFLQIFHDGTNAILNSTYGSSGPAPLLFQITDSTKMTLDAFGNLGLGVTPSGATVTTFQGPGTLNLTTKDDGGMYLTSNAYTAGGWKYAATGTNSAAYYLQYQGAHYWQTAGAPAAHTAGNAISWTSATMTLDASGNLIINDTARIGSARLSLAVNASTENMLAFKTTTNGEISALRGLNSSGSEVVALNYDTTNSAMLFRTGSTERARIDSSGNLGLGVTPSAWGTYKAVQVGNTSLSTSSASGTTAYITGNGYYNGTNWIYQVNDYASRYACLYGNGTHAWFTAPSGTAGNAITFTQAMTLDASGNLGVGLTSPIAKLTVQGAQGGELYINYNGTSTNYYNGGTHIFQNASGLAERARIDSSGNFGVGTTSPSSGIQNNNSVAIRPPSGDSCFNHVSGTASGTGYLYFGYSTSIIGSVTQSGTSAVLYNVTSDQRLKENIVDAPEFGSVIDEIQVRSYDWKSDGSHQRAGFVAQELVTVAPEAVHQPADPEEMMAVDYSKLVPMLVKELQSLRKRVAQLEGAK